MTEADRTYIRTTIYMAMGALKALAQDGDRINEIVRQLEVSVGKLDGKDGAPVSTGGPLRPRRDGPTVVSKPPDRRLRMKA